jgi:PiT family inorganic phosphate transporter
MGRGLTDLAPQQGFAAQTSAATAILASSHLGFSLSTTQVCSGAVMGAGLGRRGGAVRWSTASQMVVAWLLTLPAAGLVGAGAQLLTEQGSWGVAVTAALLVVGAVTIRALARRQPVDHTNVNDAEIAPAASQGVVSQALSAVVPSSVRTPADAQPTLVSAGVGAADPAAPAAGGAAAIPVPRPAPGDAPPHPAPSDGTQATHPAVVSTAASLPTVTGPPAATSPEGPVPPTTNPA